MIKVGINGFGRIGKCCFLQLITNEKFQICCLNATNIKIDEIEDYLLYDSTHTNYNKQFIFEKISGKQFKINHHTITLVSDKKASNINWKYYGCEYIIDATGAYLTRKKCLEYNANYVVMSAPCKDDTKTFIYGVNDDKYRGERFISASSCTTNCLTPILKLLNDNYKIKNCIFTTIHSTTASQYTVDNSNTNLRTNRSILNNIIPHTTGASSSVTCLMPELLDKITGTSVRVPVLNCSLLDINVELEDKNITLNDIVELIKNHPLYNIVFNVSEKRLVSGDFITTTTPSILDVNASIDIGEGKFKLFVWYDNEWSYSTQLLRLVETMYNYNIDNHNEIKHMYYMKNINLENKGVVCRVDLNVPVINGEITDDYKIKSIIPTIEYILSENPKYLVITSHFGRPEGNGYQAEYSIKFLEPILEKYLKKSIKFLEDGISLETLNKLHRTNDTSNYINKPCGVYLLENLRFHKEEIEYENMNMQDILNNETINIYKQLGDVFICDAFGCLHRNHMSISAFEIFDKSFGYGDLIKKETDFLDKFINNDANILAIIGGNKIKDKLPYINSFRHINKTKVFVAGGLAKQYSKQYDNVIVMNDGFGNINLESEPIKIDDIKNTIYNVYDIGINSLDKLFELIKEADIIFWNGSLGVIENEFYVKSSIKLIEYLQSCKEKLIIIGGGETASLISDKNSHIYVSTGGGALLEYLTKKTKNLNLIGLMPYVKPFSITDFKKWKTLENIINMPLNVKNLQR
jgi:glyceraldehyde 3-phosphate dehydrogenase